MTLWGKNFFPKSNLNPPAQTPVVYQLLPTFQPLFSMFSTCFRFFQSFTSAPFCSKSSTQSASATIQAQCRGLRVPCRQFTSAPWGAQEPSGLGIPSFLSLLKGLIHTNPAGLQELPRAVHCHQMVPRDPGDPPAVRRGKEKPGVSKPTRDALIFPSRDPKTPPGSPHGGSTGTGTARDSSAAPVRGTQNPRGAQAARPGRGDSPGR